MRNWNHVLEAVLERKMAERFPQLPESDKNYEDKLGDRMIKQLLNWVIAKYCDLSVSRRSILCLSLRLRQIIDLLVSDKSQYFAQPRPVTVNYLYSLSRKMYYIHYYRDLTDLEHFYWFCILDLL